MKKIIQKSFIILFALVSILPLNSIGAFVENPASKEEVKLEVKQKLEFKKDISIPEVESYLGRKMTGMEKLAYKINKKKLVKALNAPQAMSEATNTWAIVGFVTSLLIAPLGIIFSAIALGQIKKTGERGQGLAIAGLIIGIVFTVVAIASL
jgi:hypothetical protein